MITVNKMAKVVDNGQDYDYEFKGLSTDTKPTDDVGVNSLFLELDTGKFYYFNGTSWTEVGA